MNTKTKIETLRVNIWKLDDKIEELRKECELMKYQLTTLESNHLSMLYGETILILQNREQIHRFSVK